MEPVTFVTRTRSGSWRPRRCSRTAPDRNPADGVPADGVPAAALILPGRADGTRYLRYSDAVRELAAPAMFENRSTYRLTEAELTGPAPRLGFTRGRYFDGIDIGEA